MEARKRRFVTVILLVLIAVCILNLYRVLDSFANGEKWTNSMKPVAVDGLDFPIVTLCNYNRVNKSKLPEVGLDEETMWRYARINGLEKLARELLKVFDEMSLVDHFLAVLFESYWNSYTVTPHRVAAIHPSLKTMVLGRALYDEYMKEHLEYSSQIDIFKAVAVDCSSIYMCTFNRRTFDCCARSEVKITEYGACFTIRPPDGDGMTKPQQTAPGIRSGLQVYTCARIGTHVKTVINNWVETGFKLFLGYDPTLISTPAIAIPVSYHSNVEMEKTTEFMQGYSGPALFKEPCIRKATTDVLGFNYTMSACIAECNSVNTIEICDCVPHELSRGMSTKYRICSPDDMYECALPKVRHILNNAEGNPNEYRKLTDKYVACRKGCEPQCEHESIRVSTSLSKAPSPVIVHPFLSLMKKQQNMTTTVEDFASSFALLDIYFRDMMYTEIETYPKSTLDQLVGNIGGMIGLYVGFSLFTLVQLFDSCISKITQKNQTPVYVKTSWPTMSSIASTVSRKRNMIPKEFY